MKAEEGFKGLTMESKKVCFLFNVVLGIISSGCLVLCYQAGQDIWNGRGDRLMQWELLRVGFWPMVAFHAIFFVNATIILVGWQKGSKK